MQKIKEILEREGLSLINAKHTVLFYEKLSNQYNNKKYKKKEENEDDEIIVL